MREFPQNGPSNETIIRVCVFICICIYIHIHIHIHIQGFPGGSDGKESTCNAGDLGLIPGSGRSRGEGH